jgi:SAM-dependent methyltransferase
MGITSAEGKVRADGQRKFRQINKYIEIVDSLLQQHGHFPEQPHIVDMGSGKGYLTFALYDHLINNRGWEPTITGIELRENLVRFCNELAPKVGFTGLQFRAQDIFEYQPEHIDMLIALHACDIATDIAIAKGVQAGAEIIIVAPCCQKQVRKAMKPTDALQPMLRHGILQERQAELVTDGIRALLMEDQGYETKVFEFVSTEHTPKNLMIVGIKGRRNESALAEVERIKADFGVGEHYLEGLLQP